MRTHQTQTGVSPVVGAILVVAVTVILSATVGMFVFQLGSSTQDNPRAGVNIDKDLKGHGGDFAAEVQIHSMDNADYIVLKTNVTPEADEIGIQLVNDTNMMYRWRNGTIEWAGYTHFDDKARNKYRLPTPENSGTIDVTLEFLAESYEGSGSLVYAKDENGNLITPTNSTGVNIWCDGKSDSSSPTAYPAHSNLSCSEKGNHYWNDTVTLTSPDGVPIEGVYLATDLDNVEEEFWDRAQLHYIRAKNPNTGNQTVGCTECFAQFKSSDPIDHSNDTAYYGTNDAAEVGDIIYIRHMKPNTKVTIMAVKDGKKTILETYTVRDQR